MKILMITHYYPPEIGAPQTRLRETARALVGLGHDVRVLTGPPHYPDGVITRGYGRGPRREWLDGVEVRRIPTFVRPNRGFADRVIDQGSFSASVSTRVGLARWCDVMLIESPPLFLGLSGSLLTALTGTPFVFHVADPWPDFPIALGALRNPAAIRAARWVERTAYGRASLITTVSPGLVELLDANPAARGKVRLLPNGVDTSRFRPDWDRLQARREVGWPAEEFTVAYVGTVGLAQGLDTLLEAALGLEDSGIAIRVIGNGVDRDRLVTRSRELGLSHLHFEDPVPSDRVPTLTAAADALLVMLRAGPLYDRSLPTKLVEGLAAGRPLIVAAGGDAAELVADSGAGIVCPPEDSVALRAALIQMANTADRQAFGRAGVELARRRFDRGVITATLAGLLSEAAELARHE